MDELTKTLIDIATLQNFCHCGEPISRDKLFCVGCLNERHAERVRAREELVRAVYGDE
jgi:hypothetical protein